MAKIALENSINGFINLKKESHFNNPQLKSTGSSFQQVMEKNLNALQQSWNATNVKANNLVPKLPEEYRNLFELQQSVYKCHLQTEIVTKIGDSVQSTLKKLQSQGS
jgi:hypothetical protein